ncbi:MAG TPA: Coagulation factor 5/8 type domain-containing protein, partial [Solirubrobacterales bacterium]|nr:Coagulation factor 5/8 type domain-containing protein [Solirubrobacterales bacterium]
SGGPGKGWFRIVTDPYEARRVINRGKLAVVMGIEVSEPFGCRRWLGNPTCAAGQIDDWLDRLHELGIRQLEITNKFDNGLTGVAGDSGEIGVVTNLGNFYSTGSFWNYGHCPDAENSDRTPTGVEVPHNHDLIVGLGLEALLPPLGGALPVYPAAPHCNRLGLTALGKHAVRGIVERGMIFDPDHMSVKGRDEALDVIESEGYPGVMSSHSWSTPDAVARLQRLGGVVAPSASSPRNFAAKWRRLREGGGGEHYFGIGYGADSNGFATQPGPRGPDVEDPVAYPFRSFDGSARIDRQVSGERVWDVNIDGVAHYGLYPDWIEDLRIVAGEDVVAALGRGAEAYLQMWERADGIGPVRCGG